MTWGIAAVVGPLLGGSIVQYLHWPLVFWINVPIGIAAMTVLAVFHDEQIAPRLHEVDYLGAILLMIGLGGPMIVLVQARHLSALVIGSLLLIGTVALAALVAHERRVSEPILPFRM